MARRTVALIILDGWGIGMEDDTNPIHVAKPEQFKFLKDNYPMASLQASGISVGLPWGETGNSEVGHLTLGAGRVVYQYFLRITLAIRDKTFFENSALKQAFMHAKQNNSSVHLVGLLSKGNVHASLEHLHALIKMGEAEGANIKLDLFADGKDTPPHSLEAYLAEIPKEKISTLVGRYYAMDRNGSWQLTKTAYDTLVGAGGTVITDPAQAIEANYKRGFSEEFLPPLRFGENAGIQDGDAIIFFNFREDSIRQIAESFIVPDFDKFPAKKFQNLFIATMTHYEDAFTVPVAFPPDTVPNCLGETLANAGKTQFRIAETYKYAHITFFFNGFREPAFKNEYRVLIPSLSSPHPEEHPEMMAKQITDRLLEAIQGQAFDFVLANYANADTMGHTANFDAGVAAVKTIDQEIGRVLKTALETGAILLITADHGNVERMRNPATGMPESQHDPNPVPCFIVAPEFKGKKFFDADNPFATTGILADVAPTILELMKIKKPPEMSGQSLLEDLI